MKIKAILGALLLVGFTFFVGCAGCNTPKTDENCCEETTTPTDSTSTPTDTVTVESL